VDVVLSRKVVPMPRTILDRTMRCWPRRRYRGSWGISVVGLSLKNPSLDARRSIDRAWSEPPWRKTKVGARVTAQIVGSTFNFRFYFTGIIDRRITSRYSNSKVNFIALQRVNEHASKSRSGTSPSRLRYLFSEGWMLSYVTRKITRRATSTISLLDIGICDLKRLSSSRGAEIKGETSRVAYFPSFPSSRNRIWSREFWFDCWESRSDRYVIWSES